MASSNDGSTRNGSETAAQDRPPTAADSTGQRSWRTYEELDGAQGRDLFFRPPRWQNSELSPIRPQAWLTRDAVRSECRLENVSQNGCAVVLAPDFAITDGESLQITIRIGVQTACDCTARVQWVRPHGSGARVGVTFLDSLLDMDDVLRLRDLQRLDDGQSLNLIRLPWRTGNNERFKALVAEFRLLLEDARTQLTRIEAALPRHLVLGDVESVTRAELVEHVRTELVPAVVDYAARIDTALRETGPRDWPALREFSQRHLHTLLMTAPCLERSLAKPRGYPGDYMIMDYIYRRQFEGETLFGRALHHAFVNTPVGLAVRSRKELIKARLHALLDGATPNSRPLRVLSIAAGPAEELIELLTEKQVRLPLELVLFEQDPEALMHASTRLKPLAAARGVRAIFLQDSIRRLLGDAELFRPFGQFDAILCSGFFDYLRATTAVAVCRLFQKSLAPGGTAYMGNMVPENPGRWFMEQHLDWNLTYRTRDELRALGHRAAPEAQIEILDEPTGINPFLSMTRAQ